MSQHIVEITERQIRSGSYSTRVLLAGDPAAPPLLLLHDGAWGASSDVTWERAIPFLATDRYVVAPDMLGFGGTDKAVFLDRSPHSFRIEHLAGVLEALDVTGPVDVVGNSFGGAVALRALAADPGFPIRTAVSIAGSGGPWRTTTAIEELGHWDGSREDLARVLRLLLDETAHFEEILDRRVRWASVPGHIRAVMAPTTTIPAAVRVAIDDPWPRQLEGVDTPVLLVRCTRDELLEHQWATNVAAALTHASVVDVDHRHSPNVDRPEEIVAILRDFWAGTNHLTEKEDR